MSRRLKDKKDQDLILVLRYELVAYTFIFYKGLMTRKIVRLLRILIHIHTWIIILCVHFISTEVNTHGRFIYLFYIDENLLVWKISGWNQIFFVLIGYGGGSPFGLCNEMWGVNDIEITSLTKYPLENIPIQCVANFNIWVILSSFGIFFTHICHDSSYAKTSNTCIINYKHIMFRIQNTWMSQFIKSVHNI